jgi:enamine deaminase RidA (YjgF/YER057c/UK114 family)
MTSILTAPGTQAPCRVQFGGSNSEIDRREHSPALRIALPVLDGEREECLLDRAAEVFTQNDFTVFSGSELFAGFAVAPAGLELEAAAEYLYRQMFALAQNRHLYRIWNYIPEINATPDSLENYRRFCRGRSHSFEQHFGMNFQRRLPAASGVGATQGPLAIAFIAGQASPRHFENPLQMSAFEYPLDYGPRSPSFSRATSVVMNDRELMFISGTAAIRGHATVAAGDLGAQLECTLENLRVLGETTGTGTDLGAKSGWQRAIKVYLRRAADLRATQARLARDFVGPSDTISYLHADLCRADLLVEIEAVLTREPKS